MKIGGKPLRLVSLATIAAFAGIGALSLVYNYRDFSYYLATNVMSYKKQISALEAEANQASVFYVNQRKLFESLQRKSESLGRKVEELERKIENHKLSFKREVDIHIHGYEKEITVRRDWERGLSLIKREKGLARLVIHDFVDISHDTSLPAEFLGFKHPGSPWYIDQLLDRLDQETLVVDGGSDNCVEIPLRMATWNNPHALVITKVEKITRCGGAKSGGIKHHEYWLGTESDTSQWIMSLKPETGNLSRLGLGAKYVERLVDSLALHSYYAD